MFGALVGRLEYAAQRVLGAASPQLCSATVLRSVNLVFGAACLPLFHAAAAGLDGRRTPSQLLLMVSLFGCCAWLGVRFHGTVQCLAWRCSECCRPASH